MVNQRKVMNETEQSNRGDLEGRVFAVSGLCESFGLSDSGCGVDRKIIRKQCAFRKDSSEECCRRNFCSCGLSSGDCHGERERIDKKRLAREVEK